MMKDRTRRLELGKMLMDVAKYVFTLVVIGGLVSERIRVEMIIVGITLGTGLLGLGFQAIPLEEENRE